ncbi:2-keto-4-pentenoate hydratase [Myriangium duriaei CBS 260.36]|uniref:2-keto-4-pentenoate hydratase n=1 Tax=Myriangium duriaei CBS 260.36 TaxID=1168546 RepID=A0A9P4J213_9PEZI|nr:2-keto-4-pentenoate hydratase [Myriangium duriaei CBS 260.36]
MAAFKRLIRFVPAGGNASSILLGEPVDAALDVGRALRNGQDVQARVFSGQSALSPGSLTDKVEKVGKVLSPLAQKEVGTIRCIGLNYKQHAAEVKMDEPNEPVVFMKPDTALADPWPAPTIIPKFTVASNTADYESELAVVIGKACKDVSEASALDYVLGYTAANDVSCRDKQFSQSQWCFSKSFDGACPLGPVLVSPSLVQDPAQLRIRGFNNGKKVQDCGLDDLIFSVPKLVSFLSQGTTLPPGTVILTGTPAGVGVGMSPKGYLKDGDEFSVEILPHIGTMTTVYQAQK